MGIGKEVLVAAVERGLDRGCHSESLPGCQIYLTLTAICALDAELHTLLPYVSIFGAQNWISHSLFTRIPTRFS